MKLVATEPGHAGVVNLKVGLAIAREAPRMEWSGRCPGIFQAGAR